MKKIKYFSIKTRKTLFAAFCKVTIDIIEKYDVEELGVKAEFDTFNENVQALVDELGFNNKKKPLTREQDKLISQLLTVTAMLSKSIRQKQRIKDLEADTIEFFDFCMSYFNNLSAKTNYAKIRTISIWRDTYQTNEKYQSAVESLQMKEAIDSYIKIVDDAVQIYADRNIALDNLEKVMTEKVKKDLILLARELFNAIELMQFVRSDVNYKTLINELNSEIDKLNATKRSESKKLKAGSDLSDDSMGIVDEGSEGTNLTLPMEAS